MSLRFGIILLILAILAGSFSFLGQKGYIARLWNTQADSLEDFIIETQQARVQLTIGLGWVSMTNIPGWALAWVPVVFTCTITCPIGR